MPLLLQLATLVGCSMGAAVIWAHLELFGDARIGKCVFVDQAPLQVRCKRPIWNTGVFLQQKQLGLETCLCKGGDHGMHRFCLLVCLSPSSHMPALDPSAGPGGGLVAGVPRLLRCGVADAAADAAAVRLPGRRPGGRCLPDSCARHVHKPTSQWWNIVSATLQRPCCTRHQQAARVVRRHVVSAVCHWLL
jgi:pimeloyl-ACP methyl ester carboxylesterase